MDIEEVARKPPRENPVLHVDPATGYQPYHGRRLLLDSLKGPQVKQCCPGPLMGRALQSLQHEKDMGDAGINPADP